MATANFTSSTYLDTWGNGSTYISSSQDGYMGQSNSSNNYRFVTGYTLVAPSFTGDSSKITVKATVKNMDSSSFPNKTWKCGVNDAASTTYQNAYYDTSGAWCDDVTATISGGGTATLTFEISASGVEPGKKYYFYFYSGAAQYNTVKLTAVTATLEYTATTTSTSTMLYVGTTSSTSSGTANPKPTNRTVYWRVTGLGSPVKNYTGFHLYLSSGFSMNQGQTTAPTGTKVATYSSTTSTSNSFYASFNVPSSHFKIGNNTGVVCVAQNSSGYYKIGGTGDVIGSPAYPVTRYINLDAVTWFKNAITIEPQTIGQTSVTYSIKHNGYNEPRYLEYVDYCTGSTSSTGASSENGYKSTVSFPSSSSSSATKTLTVSSLSSGTSYTHYFTADSTTSYAKYAFYGLNSCHIQTDASSYAATVTAKVTGSTTATINMGEPASTNNILTSKWYLSETNSSSVLTSLTTIGEADFPMTGASSGNNVELNFDLNLTGLTSGKSYTYYTYIKTSYGNYYKTGSTTFTTDQSSYSATISGSATGSTTATVSISGLSSTTNLNSNWYLSTTNSATATSLANVVSAARTASISLTGLSSGASNTRYAYVYSSASGKYYKVGSISVTTDASSYSGTPTSTVTGSTTGTVSLASVTPTTNLDGNFYVSTTNSATTSSLASPVSATRGNAASLTGLTAGTTNTRYVYVKSSASGIYYKVGSISIATDASSYSATIGTSSVTPVGGNITISSLSSTINLDANWYISTTNNTSLPTSLTTIGSAARNNAIALSGTPGTSVTYYAYVKSTASGKYYQIGNMSMSNPSYSGAINVKKISDTKVICTFSGLNYETGLNSNWYLVNPAGARFGESRNKEIIVTGLTPATANTLTAQVYNLDKNTYYNASTKSVTTRASGFKACNTDIVINGTRNKYEPKVIISSVSKDYYPVAYLPNYLPKLGKTVTITNLIPNMAHEESSPNINTNSIVTVNTTYVHNGSASLCIKPTTSSAEQTWPISYTTASGYNNNVSLNASHKYYLSVWLYQPVKVGSFDFYWPIAEPNFISGQSVSAANTWTHISYVNTRGSFTTGNYQPRIDFNNPDGTNAMYYADLMLIDLTASFGSGNEPTKQWCDEHIPYIKTSMSLSV